MGSAKNARTSERGGSHTLAAGRTRAAYSNLMPRTFLEALSVADEAAIWSRRLVGVDARARPTTVAIGNDGRVIGFVTSGPDSDEPTSGHLLMIYTQAEAPGTAVAGDLLAAAGGFSARSGTGTSSATVPRTSVRHAHSCSERVTFCRDEVARRRLADRSITRWGRMVFAVVRGRSNRVEDGRELCDRAISSRPS